MNAPKATNADFFGFLGRSFMGAIREGKSIPDAAASAVLDAGSAGAASAEGEEEHWADQTPDTAPALEATGSEVAEESAGGAK